MKKLYNVMMLVLFVMLFASIVLSVNAQDDVPVEVTAEVSEVAVPLVDDSCTAT